LGSFGLPKPNYYGGVDVSGADYVKDPEQIEAAPTPTTKYRDRMLYTEYMAQYLFAPIDDEDPHRRIRTQVAIEELYAPNSADRLEEMRTRFNALKLQGETQTNPLPISTEISAET
jgi:hypothetical protein